MRLKENGGRARCPKEEWCQGQMRLSRKAPTALDDTLSWWALGWRRVRQTARKQRGGDRLQSDVWTR